MRSGKDVDIARDGTDEVEESCDGGTVPVPMFMQHCHATFKIEKKEIINCSLPQVLVFLGVWVGSSACCDAGLLLPRLP